MTCRVDAESRKTAVTSVLLAAMVAVLCACALLREPKPTEHTAVVEAGLWGAVYRGGYVAIASVDGVEPSWRLHSALDIRDGDRTVLLYVYLCTEGPTQCASGISVAQARVSFHAQPGHTYRPRAQEQVNGSNRFWVWVVDANTGELVGGTAPPKPAPKPQDS